MTACEMLYATLSKSLLDDIVKTSEPSAERAVDILALLQRESNKEKRFITKAERTELVRALTKTVNACKRHKGVRTTRVSLASDAQDEWDRALSIAGELLSSFKKTHKSEQKASERTVSIIVTPDAHANVNAEKEQHAFSKVKSSATAFVKNAVPDADMELIQGSLSKNNVVTCDLALAVQKTKSRSIDTDMNDSTEPSKDSSNAEDEGMDNDASCQPCHHVENVENREEGGITVFSEENLPMSLYKVAQRVYAKDDATGLLYPAFVRKVMWGPKSHQISMGFCSSLVDGEPIAGIGNDETRLEDDDDIDEDERRWGPKQNCWHYYVHYLGWNVKWDRWVEETHIYNDTASTESLSKILMKEYKERKPKKKGQKMSALQVTEWMKRMVELESEHRRLEKQGNPEGIDKGKGDESKEVDTIMSEKDDTNGKVAAAHETMQEHFKDTNKTASSMGKVGEANQTLQDHSKKKKNADITMVAKKETKRTKNKPAKEISEETLQKQAQLREGGLQMKRKKLISDQLTLPFNLKKILVEEWEVIAQCGMVHNLPSKVSVREALDSYLESKLAPLLKKHDEDTKRSGSETSVTEGDEQMQINETSLGSNGETKVGKEWIEMVEGIALFFDQALPVHLLFAEERAQYSSLRRQILAQRRNSAAAAKAAVVLSKHHSSEVATNEIGESEQTAFLASDNCNATAQDNPAQLSSAKSPPANFLPERMSEIYGCEHLLRLFLRLPGVVAEAPTISGEKSRRIFSKLGDLVRYLQKNQSKLFQSSFRKTLPGESRRGGKKAGGK